jgi:hypothetical protein
MGGPAAELPVEPLLPYLPKVSKHGANTGGDHWQDMGGKRSLFDPSLLRALDRALAKKRISYMLADRVACHLGHHPVEIWGWDWFEVVA